MTRTLVYNGPPASKPSKPAQFTSHLALSLDRPENYLPDPGLKRAANAALLLGQPLLLTGEPGVGKSQFAKALAYALGMPLLEIFAQSGMTKRDLPSNINFFMNVPVTPDGGLSFEDGVSAPGRYVEMRAERDVLVLISNCPQLNNPCNAYNPTPVRLLVWEAQS